LMLDLPELQIALNRFPSGQRVDVGVSYYLF
jgi:hypothetical protein